MGIVNRCHGPGCLGWCLQGALEKEFIASYSESGRSRLRVGETPLTALTKEDFIERVKESYTKAEPEQAV
jgi:hypothetical protein